MSKKRIYNPTVLSIGQIEDDQAREKLENQYIELQGLREIATEKSRRAALMMLQAQQEQLKAQIAQLSFIEGAAEHFEQVRAEPTWFVYRKDGEIKLENPFSERDMRNMMRQQGNKLNQNMDSLGSIDSTDMYEDNEEEN